MPKVCILPFFAGEDAGDGGIRRVVEAQTKWLPEFGWEVVRDPAEADLVASHAGNLEKTLATTPLVAHCHGLYWTTYAWPKWALQMNRHVIDSIRRADVVTAPSEWVANAIRRGAQINPTVLYHGVNLDEWPYNPPSSRTDDVTPYILWNKSRPDPICDPTPVLELANREPGYSFITTFVPDFVRIPDNVTATGTVGYSRAKLFVQNAAVYLATTRETFGIGTLEAMAAGVPVLGWNWGGQREIITHGVHGYLAKVDDYADLERGLRWCLSNSGRDAAAAARGLVEEQFQWCHAIKRYADLYDSVMESFEQRRKSPKVSVIIPAYNMASMVKDAIRSVGPSDDVEIVVVDDASTDDTRSVLNEEAALDTRIRIIHNEKNMYLAEALNVGISAARGNYIIPLDADNMLGSGAVRLLARALDEDRDFDIAYGAMEVIEPDGHTWVSTWPPQEFDYRRQMKHQNQVTSTSMYRKRVWERVGGYRRRCRTAEDADFWCRSMSFGANARKVTDAVILRYRNREDSMSHTVEDWAWHEWYPWGKLTELTPWIAPIPHEQPVTIPPYENPIVSVVIPVGPGHDRHVLDALDSLYAQTYRWWEAIVVNDSGVPIRGIPPWALVVNTSDDGGGSGAGAARNAGMGFVRGNYFVFLDADDYLQPRALEAMVTRICEVGGFVFTDWYRQETGEAYQAPEWGTCRDVLDKLPWSVVCMYPIEAWKKTGGFDEELPAWEDWDFAIRIVRAGYCGTRIPAPLFHYRMGTGNRREAGVSNSDELRERILSRWKSFITGEEEMPCGCSGGGGQPSLPALDLSSGQPTFAMPQGVPQADMVQLEYLEEVPAPLTFTGKATGTRYRFGSDDDNKVRWVLKTDAEQFISFGSFRLYADTSSNIPLAAAGPPR